jgi:hypothetical protein
MDAADLTAAFAPLITTVGTYAAPILGLVAAGAAVRIGIRWFKGATNKV